MKEGSRFNGEFLQTGSGEITDADIDLVRKADEMAKNLLKDIDIDDPDEG